MGLCGASTFGCWARTVKLSSAMPRADTPPRNRDEQPDLRAMAFALLFKFCCSEPGAAERKVAFVDLREDAGIATALFLDISPGRTS